MNIYIIREVPTIETVLTPDSRGWESMAGPYANAVEAFRMMEGLQESDPAPREYSIARMVDGEWQDVELSKGQLEELNIPRPAQYGRQYFRS